MSNAVLRKHVAFWDLSRVAEPLISKVNFPDRRSKPYPVKGGTTLLSPRRLRPSDIDIERILGLDKPRREIFDDKRINTLGCVYPEAWMEAIIGCPIYASQFSCSSEPIGLGAEEAIDRFSTDEALRSNWVRILQALFDRAVEAAGHTYPIRQPHMRGIVDMLAAYLGEEAMCLALIDWAEKLEQLASQFAELYITLARRLLRNRPRWLDGYVSSWGIYAPGELLDYQADASSLISPITYEQHLRTYDAQVLKGFPYQVLHLHTCGLHILEPILRIPELRAIEISLDREASIWDSEALIGNVQKIQQSGKGAIIDGELTDDELATLLRELDPRGLAVFYWNPS